MPYCALLVSAVIAPTPLLDLHCSLDPEHSKMSVSATVTMAPAQKTTSKSAFFLAEQMETPAVRILEPAGLAGKAEIKTAGTSNHTVTYEIALPKAIEAGQRLKLGFEYSSKAAKGFVYLLSPIECLAGGYNTCWFPSVGDSRRMLGTMEFRTPLSFIVKASGKETASTQEGTGKITRFEILQPTVPTFAAAPFKVTHIPGAMPMTLYLLEDRPNGRSYADGCSRILKVLTAEYGPYPFPDFAIIETPAPISSAELGFSGASFEGFMFADSTSVQAPFNMAYYGHEIGHQWWGNLVQMDGAKGAYMLSEAMAQYGSLQCVDQLEGPLMSARYRFTGYPGYSDRQCGYGALLYGPTDVDRPVSGMPSGYDIVYHQLANSKGFLIWDTIARQVGRDHFRKALHAVTSKYAWGSLTFDQFLDEVRAACGSKVDPILSQWLDRKGAPVVSVRWVQEGQSLHLTLTQTDPVYVLHIPVAIELGDGSRVVRPVYLSRAEERLDIRVAGPVVRVEIDPNFEVFHSTPELQAEAYDLRDYTAALFARMRGKTDEAEKLLKDGLNRIPSPDPHGAAFSLHAATGDVQMRAKNYAGARAQFEAALACPVRRARALPWAYYGLAQVERSLGNEQASLAAAKNAELADRALPYPTGIAFLLDQFRHAGG